MPRPSRALEQLIVRRALGRCEYCHFPQHAAELPFHTDHIIAEKHHGETAAHNLAWACFSCNLCKGSNIAGRDPENGKLVRLYHPRRDSWADHFFWEGIWLRGKTDVGRTTIDVLEINHPDALSLRQALLAE